MTAPCAKPIDPGQKSDYKTQRAETKKALVCASALFGQHYRAGLQVVRLQRREAIELHSAVAGGIGTGGEPVQAVANRQV